MSGQKSPGNSSTNSNEDGQQIIGVGVSISSPNLLNSAVSLMLSSSTSESDLSEPEQLIEEYVTTQNRIQYEEEIENDVEVMSSGDCGNVSCDSCECPESGNAVAEKDAENIPTCELGQPHTSIGHSYMN